LPARRKYPLVRPRRRRRTGVQRRLFWQRTAILAALAALAAIVLGLAFAGSPSRLASGVRIAGVDVGGKTPHQARSILERRADALASVPVTFRVGARTWRLEPRHLGIRVDWRAAVDAVRRQGNGFGPLRGFRRLDLRFFGADVAPPTQVDDAALQAKLDEIAAAVNVSHREASIVLHGLRPQIVPSRTGHVLDRHAAAATIVRALSGLTREPVGLPIQLDQPKINAGDLRVVQAEVRTALSAHLHLTLGATRWNLRPPRIARLLELPADGRRDLRIGGSGASNWFSALAKRVDRSPVDADWAVGKSGIRVIPDHPGYVLDVPFEQHRHTVEVNYLGTVHGTLSALRYMEHAGEGVIIQIGSALVYRSIPLQSAYCASKAAIRGFTDSLRCELIHARSRVKVCMLQLPAVNTPQFEVVRTRLPRHPMPVPPIFQPEMAARAALHLARHPRREMWVGWPAARAIFAQKFIGGLLDRYLSKAGWEAQMDERPIDARARHDNLYQPLPGDRGAQGPFGAQARPASLAFFARLHAGKMAALGTAAAVALALWQWKSRTA